MSDYKRFTVKNWRESKHTKAYEYLAELEDKIENGTLIELPCKVGDTCYCIWQYGDILGKTDTPFIDEDTVKYIINDGEKWKVFPSNWGEGIYEWHRLKDVLFTKAEAEKKLEELREKK